MKQKESFVYILTNKYDKVLYVGVTNDLIRRVYEHKNPNNSTAFTSRYNINKLIYFEKFKNIIDAITREKQLKAGSRQKKIDLINKQNPAWKDLYTDLI